MKVTSFKIYRYRLPLKSPVLIRGRNQIRLRQGFILYLTLDNSWQGFGEIAPLKDFEGVEIEGLANSLRQFGKGLVQREFPDDLEGLFCYLDSSSLIPEARFGVETAVYNALALKLKKPLSFLWGKSPSSSVMVNGLLQEEEPLKEAVKELLKKGFESIKLKAGGAVKKDIARVREVLALLNNRSRIHIDVNQRWSYDDAIRFAGEIDCARLEYIEEPFWDMEKAADFFHKTGIAIALDESLFTPQGKAVKISDGVKAWVLKPMLLGGPRKALVMADEARKRGLEIVVSSAFESGIGLFSLIHLAAALGANCRAGIDTLKYFEKDLLKTPDVIQEGKISVPKRQLSESDIRFEILSEV
ncbi:MAG: o-succinylbenzoate synthase [Candidatus Omnitrophota bacterium]